MTQQTPHERALENALIEYCKGVGMTHDAVNRIIQTYLATLLDSPEMVEKVKDVLDELWVEDAEVTMRQTAQAVIAAIKKEAGV